MNPQHLFIKKSKDFRIHFKLTEADVDALLVNKGVSYTGLELGSKTLTLDLAEAYPLIYGLEYCEFKKEDTSYPNFDALPQTTQDYINSRPDGSGKNAGLKGTKNRANYIICVMKDFPVGHTFLNREIVEKLPDFLSGDTSITWNNGLLKGLVKATTKFHTHVDVQGKKIRLMIYEIVKAVDKELLDKATKNVDEEWLRNLKKKATRKN